jgi:hypothetical protein
VVRRIERVHSQLELLVSLDRKEFSQADVAIQKCRIPNIPKGCVVIRLPGAEVVIDTVAEKVPLAANENPPRRMSPRRMESYSNSSI